MSEVIGSLEREGFKVFLAHGLREVFDLIAVRDEKLLVKVLVNIDNFSESEGRELNRFAKSFKATCIIVGLRKGMDKLRSGVVYHRFSNPCISLETFKEFIGGNEPIRFTERGQFLVKVHPDLLKCMRKEKCMTQEDLANELGVSKQTIYRCEAYGRITEDMFEKFKELFGEDVFAGVDLTPKEATFEQSKTDILRKRLYSLFSRLGFDTITFDSAIDFALEERPFLTPVTQSESEFRHKRRIIANLKDALDFQALFITKDEKSGRIPSISIKKIEKIENKDEFLDFVD